MDLILSCMCCSSICSCTTFKWNLIPPLGPLKLKRPLVCFDIESTGLNVSRDRVLEIAAVKVWPGGKVGCCRTNHFMCTGSAGRNCNPHGLAASISSASDNQSDFTAAGVLSAARATAAVQLRTGPTWHQPPQQQCETSIPRGVSWSTSNCNSACRHHVMPPKGGLGLVLAHTMLCLVTSATLLPPCCPAQAPSQHMCC